MGETAVSQAPHLQICVGHKQAEGMDMENKADVQKSLDKYSSNPVRHYQYAPHHGAFHGSAA